MQSADEFQPILRLLRRQLAVQRMLCEQGRLEEATALQDRIAATRTRLGSLGQPPEPGEHAILDALFQSCEEHNDAVIAFFQHEQKLLGREIVELQLERSLNQLKRGDRERSKRDEGPQL